MSCRVWTKRSSIVLMSFENNPMACLLSWVEAGWYGGQCLRKADVPGRSAQFDRKAPVLIGKPPCHAGEPAPSRRADELGMIQVNAGRGCAQQVRDARHGEAPLRPDPVHRLRGLA